MEIITVTMENFEEQVLKADRPVLLDFWASWCGPCRMFSPILEEFAAEHTDTVQVGKVNVDEEPELASKFGVMSIPTVILFSNGEAVNTKVGLQSKGSLEEMVIHEIV